VKTQRQSRLADNGVKGNEGNVSKREGGTQIPRNQGQTSSSLQSRKRGDHSFTEKKKQNQGPNLDALVSGSRGRIINRALRRKNRLPPGIGKRRKYFSWPKKEKGELTFDVC